VIVNARSGRVPIHAYINDPIIDWYVIGLSIISSSCPFRSWMPGREVYQLGDSQTFRIVQEFN
jgi:hypothetical protein